MNRRFSSKLMAALTALLVFVSILAAGPARAQFASQLQYVATVGGTANDVTLTVPNVSTLSDLLGVQLFFKPTAINNGAATVNVSGLGVLALLKPSPSGLTAMTGTELVTGQMVGIAYDGTQFALLTVVDATATPVTTPQGYLTPCQVSSGSPVSGCTAGAILPSGNVTAATALYYEPAVGNQIPIYNGTTMVMTAFGELTLTIPSSRLANVIYDVCVFNNSGVVTAAFGPAWATSTAGSGARGTGAGTAQIVQVSGVWTNSVSISAVNGASTFTVPANKCTVVATVAIDGTNGQVSFTPLYGQSRKWSTFNFYNRLDLEMLVGDPTATWAVGTVGPRPSNNNTANKATPVIGLPDQGINVQFNQFITMASGSDMLIGVCWNVTNAFSGQVGQFLGLASAAFTFVSQYYVQPFLGIGVATACEQNTVGGGGNNTVSGTNPNMQMLLRWRG